MASYPEVQNEAQAELEAVIGLHRLPEFSDRDSLPYVNALMKELLRWRSVVPVGPALLYRGYFIPKGSVVIANIWYVFPRSGWCVELIQYYVSPRAISNDPKIYADPEIFKPEHFLTEHGHLPRSDVRDPATISFGYGRRYVYTMNRPGRAWSAT